MSNKLTTNVQRCLHSEFTRKCQEAGRGWSDYRFKSALTRERAHCWTNRRHFGNKNSNERKLVVVSSRVSSRIRGSIPGDWSLSLAFLGYWPPDEGRSWRVYRKIRWIILKGMWRNRSWSRGYLWMDCFCPGEICFFFLFFVLFDTCTWCTHLINNVSFSFFDFI